MENPNGKSPAPAKERVVYPSHWRRTFAVPLNAEERELLLRAARQDGKAMATWMREAAVSMAKIALEAAEVETDGQV